MPTLTPSFKIEINTYPTLDGQVSPLMLDGSIGNATILANSGFTFNGQRDGIVVPRAGRYLLTGVIEVQQDAATDLLAQCSANAQGAWATGHVPKMFLSFAGLLQFGFAMPADFVAGDQIRFSAAISGKDCRIHDSWWSVTGL